MTLSRKPRREFLIIGGVALLCIGIAIFFHVRRDQTDVTPTTKPAFVLDAGKPFVLELGRGSFLGGLDIVEVRETGVVQLQNVQNGEHRQLCEATSVRLSPAQVNEFVTLVNDQKLTRMAARYSNPDILDGTQWVLWIRQGNSEKAVSFKNAFPPEIKAVADRLDAMLQSAGLPQAKWSTVPGTAGRDYQMALWNRVGG